MQSGTRGPLRSWRTTKVQSILSQGSSLRLQFPREDLGFCYGSSAGAAGRRPGHPNVVVTPDGPRNTRLPPSQAMHAHQRHAPFVPEPAPGCRMPHAWFKALSSGSDDLQQSFGHQGSQPVTISTLDLCVAKAGCFVLLVRKPSLTVISNIMSLAELWRHETGNTSIPLVLAVDGMQERLYASSNLCTWLVEAEDDIWVDILQCGIMDAMLIRPDGHVIWHSKQTNRADSLLPGDTTFNKLLEAMPFLRKILQAFQ